MNAAWRALVIALSSLVLCDCRPGRPAEYDDAQAAATRAYAAGRYAEAAELWTRAEGYADRASDRGEALARAASAWDRAGQPTKASELCQRLIDTGRATESVARCAYDNARRRAEHDIGASHQQLLALIERYPASASASLALLAYLRWLRAEQRDPLPWLTALQQKRALQHPDAGKLREQLSYSRATELENQKRLAEARDAYLSTARQFPYPQGALWDDALWHAARLDHTLGDTRAALRHLRQLLAEEEPASLQGSYERSRFVHAHFRIAEILRDELGDGPGAEREFQHIWDEHPTSLQRDDALWNVALLARRGGNTAKACAKLGLLRRSIGSSRYVRCAHLVCPTERPEKRACPAYVKVTY